MAGAFASASPVSPRSSKPRPPPASSTSHRTTSGAFDRIKALAWSRFGAVPITMTSRSFSSRAASPSAVAMIFDDRHADHAGHPQRTAAPPSRRATLSAPPMAAARWRMSAIPTLPARNARPSAPGSMPAPSSTTSRSTRPASTSIEIRILDGLGVHECVVERLLGDPVNVQSTSGGTRASPSPRMSSSTTTFVRSSMRSASHSRAGTSPSSSRTVSRRSVMSHGVRWPQIEGERPRRLGSMPSSTDLMTAARSGRTSQ